MNFLLILFLIVLPTLDVFNQGPERLQASVQPQVAPVKAQIDCSGLLSQREFGQIDGHRIMVNGQYAVGQFIGKSFVPVLYFNTLDEATSCAPDMEVAKWHNGTWVHP